MFETAKNGQSQTMLSTMQASTVVDRAHALAMGQVWIHSQSLDCKLDRFVPWMYHHQTNQNTQTHDRHQTSCAQERMRSAYHGQLKTEAHKCAS